MASVHAGQSDPRLAAEQLEIEPLKDFDAVVPVLGSKSYTNRHIAIGALSAEPTVLRNALLSEDTILLTEAVQALGHVSVELDHDAATVAITPNGNPMRAPAAEVVMGNAGTPLRLFITMASLAEGRTVITGNARMQERPMGDLLAALGPLGVRAKALRDNGSPPIEVHGVTLKGGVTRISGAVSSQFTSSLLVNAPYATEQDVYITVVDDMISKPYIDMTVAAMKRTGVDIQRDGYRQFHVYAGQRYTGGELAIEPDASGMSYFLAAAAILGGRVHIPDIGTDSVQGDVGLVDAFVRMGCTTEPAEGGITLRGGDLRGIEIDMSGMPDVAPTLALVAAYAEGRTHITGIGNLRVKECDRIDAMTTELTKMGVNVHNTVDTLTVEGGVEPQRATIDTYDDHRIAMCFAIAGLRTPGVVIRNPGCVVKSFPTFWRTLDGLRTSAA